MDVPASGRQWSIPVYCAAFPFVLWHMTPNFRFLLDRQDAIFYNLLGKSEVCIALVSTATLLCRRRLYVAGNLYPSLRCPRHTPLTGTSGYRRRYHSPVLRVFFSFFFHCCKLIPFLIPRMCAAASFISALLVS
jgi:hypothetical protein